MNRFTLAAIGALFALPVSIFAAPIVYNESVSGDLAGLTNPLTVFTFDVGVNTVSGTTSFTADPDYDSFAFIVPATLQVTSAGVTLVDLTGNMSEVHWGLYQGSSSWIGGTLKENPTIPSPGAATFVTTPLGSNTYNISGLGMGKSGSADASSGYTFSFTVAPVPEPASLALLGAAGLALARRR